MTFASRQYEELYQFVEVSFTSALSPGAVGAGATVNVQTVACTLSGGAAAQITLGDLLDVVAPASAALNGIIVTAAPTGVAGQICVSFFNPTTGGITPTAATVYKVIARRVTNNLVA